MASFKQSVLSGLTISNPTSLQFGPDGRLYISQDNGIIVAATVAADGSGGYSVTAKETISLVRFIPNHNDDGTFNAAINTRQVTGILVTGTADNPVLYVSSSDPRIGGGTSKGDTGLDTNSGILSRLTKAANGSWVKEDLVVGLPRSEENHAVNGLQINPENGHILLTVGGQTNAGAPSQEFGYLSEYAYGASIVDIDVAAIDAMPAKTYRGQTYKYVLPTVDDPTRPGTDDVVAAGQPEIFGGNNGLNQARLTPDSPVQIYATGFRNLYDIAVNENGQIYGVDNGGNPTWGGPPLYRQADGSIGTTPTSEVVNAINDGSGSINKAPLHLIEQGYYGGHATPIRANPTGAGLYRPDGTLVPLPSDWPPVPASMVNPVDGYYLPPGFSRADILPTELETPLNLRGEITTFSGSVNGIDDYRANAFNGEMKGDLVAASLNDDSIYRVDLSADGKTVLGVTNLTPTGVLGAGSALDVHAAPENGPFAGTLWVASYGGGITILTPDAGAPPGPTSQDTDSDGLDNSLDPFPLDATNGQSVMLEGGGSLTWSFSQNEAHPGPGGIGNLGFTGIMLNGTDPYTSQYDPNKTIMGGAASGVLIQDITPGTPLTDTQRDAYQFGVDIGSDVASYTITGKVNNPFDQTTPHSSQSVGFYIGTGDQANYIRLAAGAATVNGVADTPVIDVLVEVGNVVVGHQTLVVPVFGAGEKAITASDSILLFFDVDPVQGTVTPRWTVSRGSTASEAGDLFSGQGTAIQATGELLEAIRGTHVETTAMGVTMGTGLAVGIIGTSQGSNPFSATWNSINITSVAKSNPDAGAAELVFTPTTDINVSTFNPDTIKLYNLAQSGSDLKKVIIDFSSAIMPDGVFFDPNAAGGDAGKGFQINGQTGSFTASASYQNGSPTTGYRQMTLDFTGFNPGEGLSFSVDIDPDSLLGFKASVLAGGLSGAELAGSHVTFVFADGSTTHADLFGSGVAQAEARGVTSLHVAPTVSLQSVTSGNIIFPAADPTISVQGTPGSTVRVQMMSVAQQNVSFSSPFQGNIATDVTYETVVLDAAGLGSVSASLSANHVLVVAAAEVDASGRAISAVSEELRIIEQSDIPPASIVGTANPETLDGTSGDDSIDARGGDDTLNGLDGNDYLDGGTGNDQMTGGKGDDSYVVDATGDSITELAGEGSDTVRTSLTSYVLGANLENLVYTGTKAFNGTGNALVNSLTGSSGADRLDGKQGADTMKGGLGNDTYVVDNVGDVVIELAGQGSDRVLAQVSYVLPDNVETLQLTTSTKINGTGNALANTLIGNAAANSLDGREGADILTGAGGEDIFVFQRGEANGDKVTDFSGAGAPGGDRLSFTGYGADATLTQVGSTDTYIIYAGAAYDGALETIQISGVTNLGAGDYSFVSAPNQAPTNILLSNQSVAENKPAATLVGTLSAVDPDTPEAFTYSLIDSANGLFQISGANILTTAPLDYETAHSYQITVQVKDTAGHTLQKNFTVAVDDLPDGGTFSLTPGDDLFVYTSGLSYDHIDGLGGVDTLRMPLGNYWLSSVGSSVAIDINQDGSNDFFAANVERLELTGSSIAFTGNLATTAVIGAALTGTGGSDSLDGSLAGISLSLSGGSAADTLVGSTAADILDGGTGNDIMRGGLGDDRYVVDTVGDQVFEDAGAGDDTIETSLATYSLGANIERLTYTGSINFVGSGNALANTILGGIGRDRIDGQSGADVMKGGAGSDTYIVDNPNDQVVELFNQGSDDRVLSQISYTLTDNVESLQLTTSVKINGTGNGLANAIQGNAGANVIDGRGGSDTLSGGGGDDVFVFQRGEAQGDLVTDFSGAGAAGGDQLRFVGYGAGATLEHVGTSDSYVIHAGAAFGGMTETIRIVGVTTLNSGDFLFA